MSKSCRNIRINQSTKAQNSSPANKETIIRLFAQAIKELVMYIPGPDMGTNEETMAIIYNEIKRSVGRPEEIGGIPLDELGATGYGVAVATDVAKDFIKLNLNGARLYQNSHRRHISLRNNWQKLFRKSGPARPAT